MSASRASGPAVRMRGIVKRYSGRAVLDAVDFDALPGEVHALAGENGAGKTTLMRVLYGMTRADAGTMTLLGEPYAPHGPRDALARGVGMVHQHFMLVPTLTVAENAVLGREPARALAILDAREARSVVTRTAGRFGLELDPDARVEDLSVGQRQQVEILKALLSGAKVLVLDEPTAALVPSEARALLRTARTLADGGATVVFITHRLREVIEHTDRVTVLRRGRNEGSVVASETSEVDLARMMVGREPRVPDASPRRSPGEPVLVLRDVDAGRLVGISLEVRAGEIVGVAGVEGNGQAELVGTVAGLRPYRGSTTLDGREIAAQGPERLRGLGFAHVPADRTAEGIVPDLSVAENLLLGRQRERRFRRGPSFDRAAVSRHARERLEAFDVRPARPEMPAGALSGGNQQKLVIAREAEGTPRLLLAAHPTRGVDVAAREAIHEAVLALRDRGAAVLLVSADLAELLQLCDRILVLFGGRLVAGFARGESDEETLGLRMIGGGG
ncbi:MAG: ABC transporter ATP-binding protein [Candidatus Eiseniibacteriota bacterium]